MLGSDQKPVYAGGTHGDDHHEGELRPVVPRRARHQHHASKRPSRSSPDPARPGVWVYDSDAFYPLGNDEGWGNQYLDHNQDFTTEIHVSFPYKGGEIFTFRGDDDLFLFVNGRLAVDLGGVHDALTGTVDLDARAGELGLQVGKTYQDGHLPGRTPLLPVDLPHRDDVVLHQQHHRRVIVKSARRCAKIGRQPGAPPRGTSAAAHADPRSAARSAARARARGRRRAGGGPRGADHLRRCSRLRALRRRQLRAGAHLSQTTGWSCACTAGARASRRRCTGTARRRARSRSCAAPPPRPCSAIATACGRRAASSRRTPRACTR